jgi:outer membrane receptor protein involved in Fe transport
VTVKKFTYLGLRNLRAPAVEIVVKAVIGPREIGSRNTFRSPAFVNFDMGLSKRFTMPWSENHRVTLRADAFNVTNTNAFSTPNLTLESPSFGRITGSLSTPRELQFAIRYDF